MSLDVALAMGAFLGFSALWLVAVATDAGHGRTRRAVWAVALLFAVVAAAMAFVSGFATDTLPAPFSPVGTASELTS